MSQKWHQKASVQAAIVNAIPNLIIATITVVSLLLSAHYLNTQISQTQSNFDKQILRDSILNVSQDSVARKQLGLTNLQFQVLKKQFINDSITKEKELQNSGKELEILKRQNAEDDISNISSLFISEVKMQTYETSYSGENIDSVMGYPCDYENETDEFKVKKNILLEQCLTYFDPQKDSDYISAVPVLLKKADAQEYLKEQWKIGQFLVGNPQMFKKFILRTKFENKGKLPFKLLKSSTVSLRSLTGNLKLYYDSVQNSVTMPPNGKAMFIDLPFYIALNEKLFDKLILDINIYYKSIFGTKKLHFKAMYEPLDKTVMYEE
jgi:DNA-dependent RNA polymerase auxiliary subunit epsilon